MWWEIFNIVRISNFELYCFSFFKFVFYIKFFCKNNHKSVASTKAIVFFMHLYSVRVREAGKVGKFMKRKILSFLLSKIRNLHEIIKFRTILE